MPKWIQTARTKLKVPIMAALLLGLAVPLFGFNALGTADSLGGSAWQRESEKLVLLTIQAEKADVAGSGWGLLFDEEGELDPHSRVPELGELNELNPYLSQIGLAGHLFSAIASATPCASVDCLRSLSGSLSALVLVVTCMLLALVTRPLFAYVLFASTLSSPWMVAAAPNLYWVPWTWLLPTMIVCGLILSRRRPALSALLWIMLFLSFLLRFGAGYEFITSLTLMAAAIPLLAMLFREELSVAVFRNALKHSLQIAAAAFAAFLVIFFVHASMRGEGSAFDGVITIISEDVQRRTWGNASELPEVYAESLTANPLGVLHSYVFEWWTPVQAASMGYPLAIELSGSSFWILVLSSAGVVAVRWVASDPLWYRDFWILLISVQIPVSWFLLAKAHSFLHPHINFVLWYLLFIPALWFIIIDLLRERIAKRRIEANLVGGYRVERE